MVSQSATEFGHKRTLANAHQVADNFVLYLVRRCAMLVSWSGLPLRKCQMQKNDDSQSAIPDRFSALHFTRWVGYFVLCLALWEFDKATITILLVSIALLPTLLIVWLVASIRNAICHRWRSAASAFLGPIHAGGLILALPHIGLDSERIHFLLVKYPHEAELRFTSADRNVVHNWSWGLDAAPLSPGVAYTLRYDPTDAELLAPKVPEKSIRPMGDHFYVVKESEDGSVL